MKRSHLVILALLAAALILPYLVAPKASDDLLALWLAAQSIAEGRSDLVYPPVSTVFTMLPPAEWLGTTAARGHEGQIYPYLYPPIWAALTAPFTGWLSFSVVEWLASVLNPMLLLASSWLAWRALRSPMPVVEFLVIGQILYYGTIVGGVAILQNQPQILVAFLTVLTIERCRADAQIAAGAALAIAAALKLYPVLFAPIFLARGQRRAFASFLAIGGLLGVTSIILAGWPLHETFLGTVGSVANTIMKVPVAFGLDTVLATFVPEETMHRITATNPTAGSGTNWFVLERPNGWAMLSRAVLLALLVTTYVQARRLADGAFYGALWPAAIIGVALLSPLAWCYYFIAALAFAPSLLTVFGRRGGTMWLVSVGIPISVPLVQLNRLHGFWGGDMISALGFIAMVLLLIAFAIGRGRSVASA